MVLFKRTTLLLAPAFTDTDEYGKDQREYTPFLPPRRDPFRSAPFLLTGAFCQIGCPPIRPMADWDLEMIEAGRALVRQTAAGFRREVLVLSKESGVTVLSLLNCRHIALSAASALQAGQACAGTGAARFGIW